MVDKSFWIYFSQNKHDQRVDKHMVAVRNTGIIPHATALSRSHNGSYDPCSDAGGHPGGNHLHHLSHPPSRGSRAPSTLSRKWLLSFPLQ
jgi:hypothetical protein